MLVHPPVNDWRGVGVHGWGWLWMSFMMIFWVVVLGAVVYAAVRLSLRNPRERKS